MWQKNQLNIYYAFFGCFNIFLFFLFLINFTLNYNILYRRIEKTDLPSTSLVPPPKYHSDTI